MKKKYNLEIKIWPSDQNPTLKLEFVLDTKIWADNQDIQINYCN